MDKPTKAAAGPPVLDKAWVRPYERPNAIAATQCARLQLWALGRTQWSIALLLIGLERVHSEALNPKRYEP